MLSLLKRLFRRLPLVPYLLELKAWWWGLNSWRKIYKSDGFKCSDSDKLNWDQAQRILIATSTGGHLPSLSFETFLAKALGARKQCIEFFLCDGAIRACSLCEFGDYGSTSDFIISGSAVKCKSCSGVAARMMKLTGYKTNWLSQYLEPIDYMEASEIARNLARAEIDDFKIENIPIGEHALAGALRFFARAELDSEDDGIEVLRSYLEAGILVARSAKRLFEKTAYDVIVLNHGIYVPQGVLVEVARHFRIRVVTWHPAYKSGCFIFNHHETYHHGLLSEPVSKWKEMRWEDSHRRAILAYLKSRQTGEQDWVTFQRKPCFDEEILFRDIGVDPKRPIIALLTNVVWDAQLHYRANAFQNMIEWLLETIKYFAARPDLQLVIRVHPAEIIGTLPSRQPVLDEIERAFVVRPDNVFIIEPNNPFSTYQLIERSNAVLIYGTKMGVEVAPSGTPVIVAGEAWVRGKGLTIDVDSIEGYRQILDQIPRIISLDQDKKDLALRYAYHFFYRRMIPVDGITPRAGWPPYKVDYDNKNIISENNLGLDLICNGIINGSDFIFPAENLE